MRRQLIAMALILGWLAAAVSGQMTWYVDVEGCRDPGTGTAVDPFCSIQDAIDVAFDGDEIVVEPGTYLEEIDLLGKAIELRSSGGADLTVIDGNSAGTVITIVSGEGPNTVIEGFTVTGGLAVQGAGILIDGSSPTVRRCIVESNHTSVSLNPMGGGVWINAGDPEFWTCIIRDNSANGIQGFSGGLGGGVYVENSGANFVNCEITDNLAQFGFGGGVYIDDASIPTNPAPRFFNCTISGNTAANSGALYAWDTEAAPQLTNCIATDNSLPNVGGNGANFIVLDINHSNIGGGWAGVGNIDADPQFRNSAARDYRLLPHSPCIDAGDNGAVPIGVINDLGGDPRMVDDAVVADTGSGIAPLVDMGARERQLDSNLIVVEASDSIQWGIGLALPGDTVLIEPGVYNEAIDLMGKEFHLKSTSGPDVTTISATGLDTTVVIAAGGETLNTVVEGFTIRDGRGIETLFSNLVDGGAVIVDGGALTMIDCTLTLNIVDRGGGAFVWNGGALHMTNCTISDNIAHKDGGNGAGVYVTDAGELRMTGCTISDNNAFESGGGLSIGAMCDAVLTDCTISGNYAPFAGAIYLINSDPVLLDRCLLQANESDSGGSAVGIGPGVTIDLDGCVIRDHDLTTYVLQATNCTLNVRNTLFVGNDAVVVRAHAGGLVDLINCTFAENQPNVTGTLIADGDKANISARNSIFWDNATPQIDLLNGATANVTFSDYQGGFAGTGNLDVDPLFVTGPFGGYYLSQISSGQGVNSPCVDAGLGSATSLMLDGDTTRTDEVGDTGTVDMGYHFPSTIGACCFVPSGCIQLSEDNCALAEGAWEGPGTTCAAVVCFEVGACCLPNGNCLENVIDDDCFVLGGTFQGDGVTCSEAACPQPTGACCLSNGGCLELTQEDCAIIPTTTWAGAFTDCFDSDGSGAADVCETLCPPDINGDGVVNVTDLLALLAAWGPCEEPCPPGCPADTNHDCSIDVTDLLNLLAGWGSCF